LGHLALLRVDVSYMGESCNTSVAHGIDLGFRAFMRGCPVEVGLEVGLVVLRVIVDGAAVRVRVDIHGILVAVEREAGVALMVSAQRKRGAGRILHMGSLVARGLQYWGVLI
jgi:hypothetical protein